jgi:uncharacterized protein YdaU (DUF1376 family)
MKGWKRGLPPGQYYEGMVDDFEVAFTIGGPKWHRKRTEEEKQAHIAQKAANERLRASRVTSQEHSPTKDQ